jgi:hypothetical protein
MTTSTGYAEMFEWADGNPLKEDRAGWPVVIDNNDKIRIAEENDIPFGVVGGDNTSVEFISGASMKEWHGKHKRDAANRLIWEPQKMVEWVDKGFRHWYELDRVPEGLTVPPDATIYDHYPNTNIPLRREVLTPQYNNGVREQYPYTPRFERPEWAIVVIIGRVFVRECTPTNPNWIRLSGTKFDRGQLGYSLVAEYLIR